MLGEAPDVRYAESSDGLRIAYEVVGSGPFDVVFALGLVPNLEMSRELPFLRRWLDRLASFARVIHYDRRGVGLSDRDLGVGSPEERVDDIRAVMDAAGSSRASMVTSMDGGPIALAFAAMRPERVRSLALYETWARVSWAPDFPEGRRAHPLTTHAASHWGDGSTFGLVVGDAWDPASAQALLGRAERTNSSPRVAAEHFRLSQEVDVRSLLGAVQAPCLVVSRPAYGLDHLAASLAASIGAQYEALDGAHLHSWHDSYEDQVLDRIEPFLTGTDVRVAADPDGVLTTLLFTDIVGSTSRATTMGDAAWTRLLARHDARSSSLVTSHRGRLVKRTGDGMLACFDSPAAAVRCASAIVSDVQLDGIQVRTGVHTGECQARGGDLAGLAVHIASRVCDLAGPNEVLVTSTVRDLVVGSDLTFIEHGSHQLKGVAGRWALLKYASADEVNSPSP